MRDIAIASAALAAVLLGPAMAAAEPAEPPVEQLRGLSIEDLANVPVTSVSKRAESLAEAPAAAYVITREEIERSGALTLPEMLRLAPNLFVAQTSAGEFTVTARGLSGNAADQAFSNKLLVLIDGRSVYTPLFSGVYWDMQDVMPDDIDRIEVISGPGATLWGANAVNGVINIITRRADETPGGYLKLSEGDQERAASLRYGGRLGEGASWRVYARAYQTDDSLTSSGVSAGDRLWRAQGGFRLDWAASEQDDLSLHGDAFKGSGPADGSIGGGNIFGRWTHAFAGGSDLQVQAYVDREQRGQDLTGGLPLWVNTYDLDVQDAVTLGRNDVVVGGGYRAARYSLEDTASLQFAPAKGTLDLANLFAQDTISIGPDLRLIAGAKLERDPQMDWTALPNLRLSWTPVRGAMFWTSVARAIRAPTPFDRDVQEIVGNELFLHGDPTIEEEKLTAYEAGLRAQPTEKLSFSVSAYYNVYDQLRSIEITPVTFVPLVWGDLIKGHVEGLEAWGNLQASPWWRLSASVNLLSEQFRFKPGASQLLGLSQVGDDPRTQAALKSHLDLGHGLEWDAHLRYVSALPDPHVPAYAELNSRLSWAINQRLRLSFVGFNLLHKQHLEFPAPQALPVPRSLFVQLRVGF